MRPWEETSCSLQESAEVYQAPSGSREGYYITLRIKSVKAFLHGFCVLLSLSSGIFSSFELPDLQVAVSINPIKKYICMILARKFDHSRFELMRIRKNRLVLDHCA